jgi:hypothetical protein
MAENQESFCIVILIHISTVDIGTFYNTVCKPCMPNALMNDSGQNYKLH